MVHGIGLRRRLPASIENCRIGDRAVNIFDHLLGDWIRSAVSFNLLLCASNGERQA